MFRYRSEVNYFINSITQFVFHQLQEIHFPKMIEEIKKAVFINIFRIIYLK